MKVGTLFSGIGAFEMALQKEGIEHETIFACDIDKFVKESYLANHKTKYWFNDVKDINIDSINNEHIDMLVGGSPCQSFSMAGRRLGFEDTRGTLFFEFARCIQELKPEMFIFENVKGLLSHDKGNTFKTILNTFDELGYNYHWKVLNAKDFGIPQNRQRIFIIGFKDKSKQFEWPKEKELKLKVKDLLESSPIDKKYFMTTQAQNNLLQRDERTIDYFNPNYVYQSRYDEKTRENKKGIAPTLAKALSSVPIVVDNNNLRKLTPRECLRLMGFPDSFKQVVSNTQMYQQCGNSIVVDVLQAIIKKL